MSTRESLPRTKCDSYLNQSLTNVPSILSHFSSSNSLIFDRIVSCCPLSLHDALPIWRRGARAGRDGRRRRPRPRRRRRRRARSLPLPAGLAARVDEDRKSTRLNSSHPSISYAVFCLKKKKKKQKCIYLIQIIERIDND